MGSHPVAKKSHPVAKKSQPVAKKSRPVAKKSHLVSRKNPASRAVAEPDEESSPVIRRKPKSNAREPLASKKKVAPRNPAKPPPKTNIKAKIISEFTEDEPSFVEEVVEEEVAASEPDRKRKRKVEKENIVETRKNQKTEVVAPTPVVEASMEEMEPEIKIKRRRTLRRMDT